MRKINFAVKLDSKVAKCIRDYCKKDLLDFKKHRPVEEKAISFEKYLRTRAA